jgi:multiple sugar transport system ATP-binding protein
MARIVLDGVTKRFGADVVAVDDVSLTIDDGEFMVLVGPSGCGKSTILRIVAGLEELTAGEVYIGERQVTDLPAKARDIAMVFQNYALYPHMTVEQNLAFGLKLRRTPKGETHQRVVDVAQILGLDPLLQRKPAAQYGGQRQRVAMGRAMVREPQAFLMDEPLSNLDAKLRVQMRTEIGRLRDRLKTTTIYVTHDQVEAMTLGDRVAVLKDGLLQQVATPQELYKRPANLFVAAFIGSPSMNLVEANVGGTSGHPTVEFGGHSLPLPSGAADLRPGSQVILGIRPPDFEDADVWKSDDLPVMVVDAEVVEDLGSEAHVIFTVGAPPATPASTVSDPEPEAADEGLVVAPIGAKEGTTLFTARVDAKTAARPGQRVRLSVDPKGFHFFDPNSGLRLGASQPVGAPA